MIVAFRKKPAENFVHPTTCIPSHLKVKGVFVMVVNKSRLKCIME